MVNTINTLTERNKELLNKIEELAKENQEQKGKLKDRDFPKLISRVNKWLEEEKITEEYYLVEEGGGFHYGSRERTDNLDTFAYVQELIRATQYLDRRHWKWHREKIEKINTLERKLNNHKKIVSEVIEEYYEPDEDTPNWHEKLIEELEKGEKSDAIINIIKHWKSEAEKWEEEATIHLDAIGVSEVWNKRKEKELREEIDNGLELIEEDEEVIKSQQEQITKLSELYLANKPLPKTPSKFKLLREKIKTKFQQFKQLVAKKKIQKPELIAQIEIKTN